MIAQASTLQPQSVDCAQVILEFAFERKGEALFTVRGILKLITHFQVQRIPISRMVRKFS